MLYLSISFAGDKHKDIACAMRESCPNRPQTVRAIFFMAKDLYKNIKHKAKPKPVNQAKKLRDIIAILRAKYGESFNLHQLSMLYCLEHGQEVPRKGLEADFLIDRYSSSRCRLLRKTNSRRLYVEKENPETCFYLGDDWRFLRRIVFRLYGKWCMKCNATNDLHIDHIKPKSKYPHLSLRVDNLQVLCKHCNEEKSNINEDDFRTDAHLRILKEFAKERKKKLSKKAKAKS
jgi:5-methylcytosine-specific restriction endonuclease McrA